MAEVDPVILKLIADNRSYRAELLNTTRIVTAALAQQQRSVQNLERQIKASSGQIGGTLKGLAGSFAAYLSVQQITGIIDSFTRFQNQLKVTGLEGDKLARVQERLIAIGAQYGVGIESLAGLFGNASQAGKDLGVSQAQILKLTEATSQALKITGVTSAQASGAILGLTQSLSSGTVKAEEFNQINEGGLRPLLQAAAASERFGGSVGKLRAAVISGKVTSKEFFDLIMAGSQQLEGQAAKATLTLSGAYTKLTNALTVYIGQSAQANGLTGALAGGLDLLAKNLDTVADALALIGIVLFGRYVAGLAAAAAGTFAFTAVAGGAATVLEGVALAATAAGRALLAAFGGPVGLAVAALATGIYFLATATDDGRQASAEYAAQAARQKEIQDKVTDATDRLATATGRARIEALKNAEAVRQETIQYIAVARAALAAARAKAQEAHTASKIALDTATGSVGRGFESRLGQSQAQFDSEKQAVANERAAAANLRAAKINQRTLEASIAAPPPVATSTPKKEKKGRKGSAGRSAEEIEKSFVDDLDRSRLDLAQAQAEIIGTLEARRDFELERIESDRIAQVRAINANKDYNNARKQQLLDLNDEIAEARRAAVAAEEKAQAADDALQLAVEDLRNEQEILEASSRLADTAKERKDIELRLLDLQYKEERLRLEAIRDNEKANKADREAARRRLATLDQTYGLARESVERRNESPLAAYYRRTNKNRDQISEEVEAIVVSELDAVHDGITDALTKAIGVEDPLIKQLLHLFIEQVIMKPIAEALRNASSQGFGGDGSLSGILSSIGSLFGGSSGASAHGSSFASSASSFFGRASGGYVGPGQLVRVNEAASGKRVEGWRPQGAGHVIPLGQMQAGQGGGARVTIHQHFTLDARGGIMTPELIRGVDAKIGAMGREVYKQAVKTSAKQVPSALAKFQTDGPF